KINSIKYSYIKPQNALKISNIPDMHIHGTTTLAFIYQNGIIVAVDSRASMGDRVATQNINKVIEFSPHILGTMAGSAPECQHAGKNVSLRLKMFEAEYEKRPSILVVGRILQRFFRDNSRDENSRSGI
ncbi:MAG: threonine-type endopeptidase activity, partial [Paramarteilia canceri]